MLTQAALHNFKSWKRISDLRFAPITGLFGTNSSGKTSILQWLLMLKQTVESSDRLQVLNFGSDRDPVELGTFRDVVHGHVNPGQISWKLSWRLPKLLEIVDPAKGPDSVLFEGQDLAFSCDIHEENSRPIKVAKMTYDFAGQQFIYKAKEGKSGYYKLTSEGDSGFSFVRNQGRAWDLPAPVKCHGFPDQVMSYYQNAGFLADFQLALENSFSRTFYLGPLREYPKRQYPWTGTQPGDMGRRGEKVIDAILASRERGEKIPRGKGRPKFTVEQYAAYWLKELNLIHAFSIKSVAPDSNLYQVHVQKTPNASDVLITDVGFGISQILPVLVLCYYVPVNYYLGTTRDPPTSFSPSRSSGCLH